MQSDGFLGILPIIVIFAIFFLLIILPQRNQVKARKAMLDSLKAGDMVETVGRIFGTIESIEGTDVYLNIGVERSTRIRISIDGIERVVPQNDGNASDKQ